MYKVIQTTGSLKKNGKVTLSYSKLKKNNMNLKKHNSTRQLKMSNKVQETIKKTISWSFSLLPQRLLFYETKGKNRKSI